jgi:hypothetical protein
MRVRYIRRLSDGPSLQSDDARLLELLCCRRDL